MKPVPGRMMADIEGEFVVFLIGMRIHKLWKVWSWLPVFLAMPRMLIELGKYPELGLLHARTLFSLRSPCVIQYWRSPDHLLAYASEETRRHLPAWRAFQTSAGKTGNVGIWHETYIIKPGQFETIYTNMPPTGLGVAGSLQPVNSAGDTARKRLKRSI